MKKQVKKIYEYELPIKIEPQKEGGFLVSSPAWPDCYAQGETIGEAVLEVTGVAQSLIELYKEEGLKIPLKQNHQKTVDNLHNLPVIVSA